MRFYLLDEALRSTKLVDEALQICANGKSITGGVKLQKTFGDLDGQELYFSETDCLSKCLVSIHVVAFVGAL